MASCATHPRRPAASSCVRCSRSMCAACIVHTSVGFKCATCTGTVTSARRLRLSRRRLPLVVLAAAAAVLVAVAGARLLDAPPGTADDAEAVFAGVERRAVTFQGHGSARLTGVLDLPAGRRAPAPGVVVVPGFGPTSRDGIAPDGLVTDALYRDLGDALAAAGIVVLRYDKRGTGGSRAGQDDGPLAFDQLAGDAAAAVAFLRDRPEVAGRPVALVGHDEGALVGLRLGGRGPGPSGVAALALVSVPGRPLAEVVADEIRAGGLMARGAERAELAAELEAAVAHLLDEGRVPPVSSPLRAVLPAARPAYLVSVFGLDPRELAAAVRVPVLLVHGEADPGIRDADVVALVEALPEQAGVEVLSRPDADHTLRLADPHGHDRTEPARRAQRDREALRRITEWLGEQLRA